MNKEFKNKNILIVEDDRVFISFYKGILSQLKCKLDFADSVESALSLMNKIEYSIYILDLKLKDKSLGTELIGKYKASPKKCIILSGNLIEDKVNELVNLYSIPRLNIMVKPPEEESFINRISYILELEDNVNTEVKENIKLETINIKLIFKELLTFFKNLKLKFKILILILIISIPTIFSTYLTYIGYKLHKSYIINLDIYCETKFKYFKKDNKISKSTFIEKEINVKDTYLTIRFYPNNFISILVTSEITDSEPQKYWILSSSYQKELINNYDKTFLYFILGLIETSKEARGIKKSNL